GSAGLTSSSFGASGAGALVTPALNRGLKPAGLLDAAMGSAGLTSSFFGFSGSAAFVAPALNRGLKPAGLLDGATGVAGSEENSSNISAETASSLTTVSSSINAYCFRNLLNQNFL